MASSKDDAAHAALEQPKSFKNSFAISFFDMFFHK